MDGGGTGKERGRWRGRDGEGGGGVSGSACHGRRQEVRVPLTTRERKGSTAAPLQRRLGECPPAVPGLAPAPPHRPLLHLSQLVGDLRHGRGRRENRSVEQAKQRAEVYPRPIGCSKCTRTHNADVGLAASSSPRNKATEQNPPARRACAACIRGGVEGFWPKTKFLAPLVYPRTSRALGQAGPRMLRTWCWRRLAGSCTGWDVSPRLESRGASLPFKHKVPPL